MDVLKQKWVLTEGSVWTERLFEKRTVAGQTILVPELIVPNAGDKLGKYLVELHNSYVESSRNANAV